MGVHLRHSIFWLHASSAHRLEQGLKGLAKNLGFATEDLLPAIHDWFSGEQSGKWLLIIDNADDEDIFFKGKFVSNDGATQHRLCDFLPKKQGCGILYTSRNETCARKLTSRSGPANLVAIKPMSTEEAVELVEKRLDTTVDLEDLRSTRSDTEELVEILEKLPLALVQATEMMKVCHDTIRDPKGYLELWNRTKQDRQDLLKAPFFDRHPDSDLPNTVFHSWTLSFEQLKKQDEGTVRLLSLMSIFDRQSIPEWLLAFYPHMSSVRRLTSLSLLRSFSFIRPNQDTNSRDQKWQMHRLVQMATHAYISQDDMERTLGDGLRMLAEAFFLYIYSINGRRRRYERSLEYYPHAKSVIHMLQNLGGPTQQGDNSSEPAAIVKQTLEDFASKFKSNSRKEIGEEAKDNTRFVYETILEGNANSLENVVMFVKGLQYMSGQLFRYNGKRPPGSDLIYGEQDGNSEERDAKYFEKYLDYDQSKWERLGQRCR